MKTLFKMAAILATLNQASGCKLLSPKAVSHITDEARVNADSDEADCVLQPGDSVHVKANVRSPSSDNIYWYFTVFEGSCHNDYS